MHYLAYVYGPSTAEQLTEILAPFNECPSDEDICSGKVRRFDVVMMTNIPVMTLETTLFDMISEFRKVCKWKSPILLVDDAEKYLDHEAVSNLDAFIISYNLESKACTAQMVVSRAFWDWWVIGGRWPIEFESKTATRNVVADSEVSWCVDKEALAAKQGGRFTSVYMSDVDWKKEKREHVKNALAIWDVVSSVTVGVPRASDLLEAMHLPNGTQYYQFRCDDYDAWVKDIHEKVSALPAEVRAPIQDMFCSYLDIAGMTRRELIRYAIMRTYVPSYAILHKNEFEANVAGWAETTLVFDYGWGFHPTDKMVKNVIRLIEGLSPSTVVTAVDIHN